MGINRVRDKTGRIRIEVRRRWPDGTQYRRFFDNLTIADKTLTRSKNSIYEGTWKELRGELSTKRKDHGPDHTDLTISDFSSEFLEQSKISAPRSWKRYELSFRSLNAHFGDTLLAEFRRDQLHGYVERRVKEVSRGTVNRDIACICAMFSCAIEKGKLAAHPLTRFPRLKVPEVERPRLTLSEYRTLVNCMDSIPIGSLVAIMGETAARKGEALWLKWSNVNFVDKRLALTNTKNGKVRYVPLSDYALAWFAKLVRYVNCPYICVNTHTGRRWSNPTKAFKRGAKEAGLEWVGFHDLRRFRACQWRRNGVPVDTVRRLLGHVDTRTTELYLKGFEPYLEEVRQLQSLEGEQSEAGENRATVS